MASDKGKKIAVEYDDEAVEDVRDHCISRFSLQFKSWIFFTFFFFEKDEVLTSKRLLFGGYFVFEVIGSLNFDVITA